MKRRCRQPSRQLRRCGGRERPSGRSVTGTSAIRKPRERRLHHHLARRTPCPGSAGPGRRTASRRKARRPQWKSWTGAAKNRRPRAVSTGLPIQRCFQGMAPGRMRPAARRQAAAHDQVRTAAQARQEPRQRAEVVGAVGVAHQDEAPARGRDAAQQRVAVAPLATCEHPRPGGAPRSPASRRCCHCRRPAPRPRRRPPRAPHAPRATQAARVSASFRHGMTIVTSSAAACRGGVSSRARATAILSSLKSGSAGQSCAGGDEIKGRQRNVGPKEGMMAKESPMQAVATKLAHSETVLLDGATGTELQRRGVPMDDAAWCALAVLTHPEVLQAVHEDYLRLGAEVITTNTFASARHMMARAGRAEDTIAGYRAAVAVARAARDRLGRRPPGGDRRLDLDHAADPAPRRPARSPGRGAEGRGASQPARGGADACRSRRRPPAAGDGERSRLGAFADRRSAGDRTSRVGRAQRTAGRGRAPAQLP